MNNAGLLAIAAGIWGAFAYAVGLRIGYYLGATAPTSEDQHVCRFDAWGQCADDDNYGCGQMREGS